MSQPLGEEQPARLNSGAQKRPLPSTDLANGDPGRPYIGGQAVIEGVMMRSPGSLTVVCRRRSGALVVRERPMPAAAKGPRS